MKVVCPACHKNLKLGGPAVPKRVKCPACKTPFDLPILDVPPPNETPTLQESADDLPEKTQKHILQLMTLVGLLLGILGGVLLSLVGMICAVPIGGDAVPAVASLSLLAGLLIAPLTAWRVRHWASVDGKIVPAPPRWLRYFMGVFFALLAGNCGAVIGGMLPAVVLQKLLGSDKVTLFVSMPVALLGLILGLILGWTFGKSLPQKWWTVRPEEREADTQ